MANLNHKLQRPDGFSVDQTPGSRSADGSREVIFHTPSGEFDWELVVAQIPTSEVAVEDLGVFPNFGALPPITPALNKKDLATVGNQVYRVNDTATGWEIDPEFAGSYTDINKATATLDAAQFAAQKKILHRPTATDAAQTWIPKQTFATYAAWNLAPTFEDKWEPLSSGEVVHTYENVLSLPDPISVKSGTQAIVYNDADDLSNGIYVAVGVAGANAEEWVD